MRDECLTVIQDLSPELKKAVSRRIESELKENTFFRRFVRDKSRKPRIRLCLDPPAEGAELDLAEKFG